MAGRRGRPKGSSGPATFKHYKPRRWRPEFDLMVIDSIAGKSNEEIGLLRGYTKEHVSNILSTQEAENIRARIRETINKQFDTNLKDRLAAIGEKAISKIEAFIEDDRNLQEASPFMFIDRAIKIAQSVSVLDNGQKGGNTTIVNGNAIVMNNDQASNLREALLASKELDEIQAGDKVEERIGEVRQLRIG